MRTRCTSILLLIFLSSSAGMLFAQSFPLRLLKSSKGFYLEHKVAPKQGLYSIGRQYSVHPNQLAAYNNLDAKKGLQIDQLIRIPLSDSNFDRTKGEGVPIYLTVATDDVSTDLARFAGVELRLLHCWNRNSDSLVKKGSRWIVGFLITNEWTAQQLKLSCTVKETTQSSEPTSVNPTPTPTVPSISQPAVTKSVDSYFESAFQEQIRKTPVSQTLTVFSSLFRTQSGRADGKHYVLIDNLVPGTVVKLVNPSNQRVVFAKVLGEMPRIRQNEGLDIRISDAAAERLGVGAEGRFPLQLIY